MTLTFYTHIPSVTLLVVCIYQRGTNADGPESQMLHAEFRGNRSTGSGEVDF